MSATMSPSALKPFGIKRVCTVWNISRSTIHRHKVLALHGATPKKKRGPTTYLANAQLFEEIKIVLRTSAHSPRRLDHGEKTICSLRLGAEHRQDLARTTEQSPRNNQTRCGQSTALRA